MQERSDNGNAEEVRQLQQSGEKLAMVEDEINDALALATADSGMAIGTGKETGTRKRKI